MRYIYIDDRIMPGLVAQFICKLSSTLWVCSWLYVHVIRGWPFTANAC